MFARSNRLSRSCQVVAVVRHGSSQTGRHWRLLALRPRDVGGQTATAGRCTVVVSKKTAKLSVTRNRLKRRVREAVMAVGLPADTWVVIFPRPSAGTAPQIELVEDYRRWRTGWTSR